MPAVRAHIHVETLHRRLRARLATLAKPVAGDVMRVFLEISSVALEKGLWSLEFSFDEDDSRIARLEAQFGDGTLAQQTGGRLEGYAVLLLLPKTLPKYTAAGDETASEHLLAVRSDPDDLVARFVRSVATLGAYRLIEALELESIETERI